MFGTDTGGLQSMDVMGLPSTGGLADLAPALNQQTTGTPNAYPYPSQNNDAQANQAMVQKWLQALGMGAKIAANHPASPLMATPQARYGGTASNTNFMALSPYQQGVARQMGLLQGGLPAQQPSAIHRMPGLLGVGNGTA